MQRIIDRFPMRADVFDETPACKGRCVRWLDRESGEPMEKTPERSAAHGRSCPGAGCHADAEVAAAGRRFRDLDPLDLCVRKQDDCHALDDAQDVQGIHKLAPARECIGGQLMKVQRDRRRQGRRGDSVTESLDDIAFTAEASLALGRMDVHELEIGVQQILAGQQQVQQDICMALAEGHTQVEIARRTNRSKAAICEEVKGIRTRLRALGVGAYAGRA